jgi:hypothetical protein
MEDNQNPRITNGRFVPRRNFARWKEKPFRTKAYIEFLAHYDAELRKTEGPIAVVKRSTGIELPLEQKGKLLMVKLLLDEFGTIDGANKAIGDYLAATR